jgi:hypothetical protein
MQRLQSWNHQHRSPITYTLIISNQQVNSTLTLPTASSNLPHQ